MSTQPLAAAIASTRQVMAAVTPEQMSMQSPCAQWTVAGVINHVIGAQGFFVAGLTGTPPGEADVDHAAGDYMAAYDTASQASLEAFGAEGIMEKMIQMPFGEMPGAAVMGLAVTDTFTHGWDIAKGSGQSTDLAPELAAGILAQAQASISDGFRGEEGAPFGAEQQCADGACAADQLAAFLGRSV